MPVWAMEGPRPYGTLELFMGVLELVMPGLVASHCCSQS